MLLIFAEAFCAGTACSVCKAGRTLGETLRDLKLARWAVRFSESNKCAVQQKVDGADIEDARISERC